MKSILSEPLVVWSIGFVPWLLAFLGSAALLALCALAARI